MDHQLSCPGVAAISHSAPNNASNDQSAAMQQVHNTLEQDRPGQTSAKLHSRSARQFIRVSAIGAVSLLVPGAVAGLLVGLSTSPVVQGVVSVMLWILSWYITSQVSNGQVSGGIQNSVVGPTDSTTDTGGSLGGIPLSMQSIASLGTTGQGIAHRPVSPYPVVCLSLGLLFGVLGGMYMRVHDVMAIPLKDRIHEIALLTGLPEKTIGQDVYRHVLVSEAANALPERIRANAPEAHPITALYSSEEQRRRANLVDALRAASSPDEQRSILLTYGDPVLAAFTPLATDDQLKRLRDRLNGGAR